MKTFDFALPVGTETVKEVDSSFTIPTGYYALKITAAYITDSGSSDSQGVTLAFTTDTGRMLRLGSNGTIWFRGKDGKVTTEGKFGDTKGKIIPTYGYNQLEAICQAAAGKSFADAASSITERTVEVYGESTQVPMILDLVGATVNMTVFERRANKQALVEGKYTDTNEEVVTNELHRVLPEGMFTVSEIEEGAAEPKYITNWLKKNEGKIQDKFKEVSASSVTSSAVIKKF